MGKWIAWTGGKCPVSGGVMVNVKLGGGGGSWVSQSAEKYEWDHNNGGGYGDIISYQISDQQAEDSYDYAMGFDEVEMQYGKSTLSNQIDGNHYSKLRIQPVEFIHANNIPFIEGCVIKYVTRWKDKGGVKDLRKAKHFIEMLIEFEEVKPVMAKAEIED